MIRSVRPLPDCENAHNSCTAWYILIKFCIRMYVNIRLATDMRNNGRGFAEHQSSWSW